MSPVEAMMWLNLSLTAAEGLMRIVESATSEEVSETDLANARNRTLELIERLKNAKGKSTTTAG